MGWANKNWGTGTGGTAVTANVYQPITTGNDGDTVTAGTLGTGDIFDSDIQLAWTIIDSVAGSSVKISTLIDTEIAGPINVDGTNYSMDTGKTWRWSNKYELNYVGLEIQNLSSVRQNYDKMTIGCILVPGEDELFYNQHDDILINGDASGAFSSFAVLQTNIVSGNYIIRAHSAVGYGSTYSDPITIVKDTRYWVNLNFDGPAGKVNVAVYTAADMVELTGSPVQVSMDVGEKTLSMSFGRTDAHGDNAQTEDFSEIGQVIIDTTGVFPLLPEALGSTGKGWNNNDWGN